MEATQRRSAGLRADSLHLDPGAAVTHPRVTHDDRRLQMVVAARGLNRVQRAREEDTVRSLVLELVRFPAVVHDHLPRAHGRRDPDLLLARTDVVPHPSQVPVTNAAGRGVLRCHENQRLSTLKVK